jgi:hypothetical protein
MRTKFDIYVFTFYYYYQIQNFIVIKQYSLWQLDK